MCSYLLYIPRKCQLLITFVITAVDTSEAGFGDLDVSVTQSGIGVPVKRNQFSLTLARYSFTAKLPKQHMIHISFNGENIPGQCRSFQFVDLKRLQSAKLNISVRQLKR